MLREFEADLIGMKGCTFLYGPTHLTWSIDGASNLVTINIFQGLNWSKNKSLETKKFKIEVHRLNYNFENNVRTL